MAQVAPPGQQKSPGSNFKRNIALLFSVPVMTWALYDFGATIFSMNIISRYFSLWVTETNGAPDIYYSLAVSVSMIIVVLLSPLLGVLIDWRQKKVPYVRLFGLACIALMIVLGLLATTVFAQGSNLSLYLMFGLIIFVVCNVCYNASIVFYNSMLPDLGAKEELGRISGWGIAVSYCGTVTGLIVVQPFVKGNTPQWLNDLLLLLPAGQGEDVNANAFVPTALLFLLFALPLFIFGKDKVKPVVEAASQQKRTVAAAYRRVMQTIKEAKTNYRSVFLFLIAYFFYMDAVNTVVAFMSIYATRVIGFTAGELTLFLIGSTSFAIVGSFVLGLVSDWIGSKKALYIVLALWTVALVVGAFSFTVSMFWITGILAGIGMGSASVVSRKLLVELSPVEKQGEFFGLYAISGRMSAVLGPLVWGAVTAMFPRHAAALGNRFAVASLLVFIVIGWFFLARVKVPAGESKTA
ncbi:MFS transporter [Numidum massiliense]|uniref:MFS transporter n=1 Tax=Numidum massiliense TaxID=1522315 RepID=UPI0006D5421C|nr:MFS transporter [Numidum massiliense]